MAANPDVVGVIERTMKELRLELYISQPYASSRTVTVALFYGDELISKVVDYIPKDRDDGY